MAPEPNTEVTQANVRTEVRGSTLIVTIDRPDGAQRRRPADGDALADAFAAFDARRRARRGDPHRCRRHVLRRRRPEGGRATGGATGSPSTGDAARWARTRMQLAKPVIAAVEGFAVAGGLELALWCDLRVAATDAMFGVYCRRWGVPLVDGGTVRLPRLIGQSRALDLILTGRGVSGDEAAAMGLVNRLTDPGRALDRAVELAGSSPPFPSCACDPTGAPCTTSGASVRWMR